MKTLRFKSSLKCNGCVNAIKPGMQSIDGIKSWRVILDVQDKVIEVDTEDDEEKIAKAVQEAVTREGYSLEKLSD
ncbi:MAG: heavy metal-associated protein [Marinilabiliales bacterium]|nr:MAG: heavy metal-associated protein [Marinilabiliales bacterium]